MTVSLKGSSPHALTAGILLLSRARQFGQRLDVEIVGAPADVASVTGPAMVHSATLASCGVGRSLGSGALVIVPGPAVDRLAISLAKAGCGEWFEIDRGGDGASPATQALVRLCRSADPMARSVGRRLQDALGALGCPAEPGLLDLLFSAPAPPLQRVSLALRAGRAMAGPATVPMTRVLRAPSGPLPDPLDCPVSSEQARKCVTEGTAQGWIDRLTPWAAGRTQEWMHDLLAADTELDPTPLLGPLAELASHLAALPATGFLPPLEATCDALAVGLPASLGACAGPQDANQMLVSTFQFLGGRFVPEADWPYELPVEAPPAGRLARWAWFCRATQLAADTADTLWRRVIDPAQ